MVGEKNMCGPPNEGGEVCFNIHMLTRMTKSMWSVAQKIMVKKRMITVVEQKENMQ